MTEPALSLAAALGVEAHVAALEERLRGIAAAWPVSDRLRGAISAEVVNRLRDALDLPLVEVLAAGWRGTEACRALGAQEPGETETLELAEHVVRWTTEPVVEVVAGGVAVAEVPFRVEAELRVRAGVLVVEGGRFVRLHAAALEVAAELSAGGEVAAWSRPLPVPGTLSFGPEGIPVTPPPGAVGSAVPVPAIVP